MVDTGEAELVREIFQLRLQGQGSYRIARLLTLRRIKTKRGHSSWSPKVIVGILSNTAYIGRLYYGKYQHVEPESRRKPINLKNPRTSVQTTPREQWLEIPVPSIIDQETFDTVQDLIAHSKETNPRRRSRDYLFLHGRLQCVCGRVMNGYYDGHHQRRRYRCTRKQYPRCGRIVDAEWIEAQGWSVVEALMELDPRYVEMELRRRSTTQQYTYRHADLESSKQSIEKKVIEMQRLDRAYLAGAFELSRFTELKSLINRELAQLRHLQDKIQEDLDR